MTDRIVKISYLNQNEEFSGEMKNVYFSLNLLCKMIRQKVIGLRFYANEQEIMHLNYLLSRVYPICGINCPKCGPASLIDPGTAKPLSQRYIKRFAICFIKALVK